MLEIYHASGIDRCDHSSPLGVCEQESFASRIPCDWHSGPKKRFGGAPVPPLSASAAVAIAIAEFCALNHQKNSTPKLDPFSPTQIAPSSSISRVCLFFKQNEFAQKFYFIFQIAHNPPMDCYNCDTPLIWGGDHDDEDEEGNPLIVSNLSCPKCDAIVFFCLPKKEK